MLRKILPVSASPLFSVHQNLMGQKKEMPLQPLSLNFLQLTALTKL